MRQYGRAGGDLQDKKIDGTHKRIFVADYSRTQVKLEAESSVPEAPSGANFGNIGLFARDWVGDRAPAELVE